MSKIKISLFVCISLISFYSCDQEATSEEPKLILKFKFDPNQARLGNFGEPADILEGHAGQTPDFNLMGVHYIELAEKNDIPVYNGFIVDKTPTTTKGGTEAIDFDQALYAGDGEVFFTTELEDIQPGTYEHLRLSLSYQNYTVDFRVDGTNFTGTIASFIGANTYIDSYQIKNQTVNVDGNKLQGYFAFETNIPNLPVQEGQAPAGATTVPNPLFDSSPIPPGSCLVTGTFSDPLIIDGDETSDITIVCSISINKSFEWIDVDGNNTYDPLEGDQVVNMGVRGLIPSKE